MPIQCILFFFVDIILNKMFYKFNIYIILFKCNVNDHSNSLSFRISLLKKCRLQRANLISNKNGRKM